MNGRYDRQERRLRQRADVYPYPETLRQGVTAGDGIAISTAERWT